MAVDLVNVLDSNVGDQSLHQNEKRAPQLAKDLDLFESQLALLKCEKESQSHENLK